MQAMKIRKGWMAWLAAVALLGASATATAAPMTYLFQSGQIRVEASSGAQVFGLSNLADLDGFSVTLDTEASVLNSMLLTSGGPVSIALSPGYGGYDAMTLTDISLSGGPGTLDLLMAGPPALYRYQVDPLTFAATLDATGPAVVDIDALAISAVTDGSGFISLDTAASALFLQGVTIGEISSADLGIVGGPSDTLVLKADFVFVGQGVIPEPNGARLMGLGILIVGLAGFGRRAFAG